MCGGEVAVVRLSIRSLRQNIHDGQEWSENMKMKATTQSGKTFYSVGLESVNSLIMHVRDKKCIVPTAEGIQKMRREYPADALFISQDA